MKNAKAWLSFAMVMLLPGVFAYEFSLFASSSIRSFAGLHPDNYLSLVFLWNCIVFCGIYLLLVGSFLVPGYLLGMIRIRERKGKDVANEMATHRTALLVFTAAMSVIVVSSFIGILILVRS